MVGRLHIPVLKKRLDIRLCIHQVTILQKIAYGCKFRLVLPTEENKKKKWLKLKWIETEMLILGVKKIVTLI